MKPIFRNAMFGFNREDVFSFISKQSKQYEQKISEMTAEKERLEKELEEEKQAFASFSEKMESKRLEVEASQGVLEEIKLQALRILDGKDKISGCVSSCNENANSMKNNILVLKEQVSLVDTFKEKAMRFDQLSNALSGIFGNGEAKEGASGFTVTTEQPLEEFSVESFDELGELFGKLSVDLQTLADICNKLSSENE